MQGSLYLFVLPPLLLVPAMGLLSMVRSTRSIGREFRRKSLHVATGLASLSLPAILIEPWMVVSGLALVLAWMIAVRVLPCLYRRFGPVLHECRRRSMGEIWFAVSLAVLMLYTSGLEFVIPVLVLSLADAAAAITGRLVPSTRLGGPMRGKTLAGCTAFFLTAFVICLAMLTFYTALSSGGILICALSVAVASCLAEAVARRGLDNLAIPLVIWAVLAAFPI